MVPPLAVGAAAAAAAAAAASASGAAGAPLASDVAAGAAGGGEEVKNKQRFWQATRRSAAAYNAWTSAGGTAPPTTMVSPTLRLWSMLRTRPMGATVLAVAATGAVATVCVPSWRQNVVVAGMGAVRLGRVFYTSARIMIDFKLLDWRYDKDHEDYRRLHSELLSTSAHRMLDLCKANGGVFIKLAQHISAFGSAPREIVDVLSVLQDKAPFRSYETVERLFLKDTGKRPHELFESFEQTPIAAASLAQVHRAKTKDGQVVAVKVQYPDVSELYEVDLWGIETMASLASRWFDAFDMTWLVREFRTYLMKEVDFVLEALNAERAATLFADQHEQLKIPTVRWDLTAPRILTMEFCEGVKINDVEAIKKQGLNPVDVANIVVSVFSDMIFTFGWLHADPHPGNLLVRKNEHGKPQVVLLDHGLYRDLGETVRVEHCKFWKAMIVMDGDEMEKSAEALGAGKFAWIFPVMFSFQPMTGQIAKKKGTREEMRRVREMMETTTMEDMTALFDELPRELILLLRSMGLIHALNQTLGGSQYTRLTRMADSAIHGLYVEPGLNDRHRLKNSLGYYYDLSQLHWRLWVAWAATSAVTAVRYLLGYKEAPDMFSQDYGRHAHDRGFEGGFEGDPEFLDEEFRNHRHRRPSRL